VNLGDGFRRFLVFNVGVRSRFLGGARGIGRLRRSVLRLREPARSLASATSASAALALFLAGRG